MRASATPTSTWATGAKIRRARRWFYSRPHEIEVTVAGSRTQGIIARIRDVRRLGGVVRLELERSDGLGLVEAEMSRDEFQEIGLFKGDEVLIQPKRLRVFGKEVEPARAGP
jgi:sulfate transport system ATP-binding protein